MEKHSTICIEQKLKERFQKEAHLEGHSQASFLRFLFNDFLKAKYGPNNPLLYRKEINE